MKAIQSSSIHPIPGQAPRSIVSIIVRFVVLLTITITALAIAWSR